MVCSGSRFARSGRLRKRQVFPGADIGTGREIRLNLAKNGPSGAGLPLHRNLRELRIGLPELFHGPEQERPDASAKETKYKMARQRAHCGRQADTARVRRKSCDRKNSDCELRNVRRTTCQTGDQSVCTPLRQNKTNSVNHQTGGEDVHGGQWRWTSQEKRCEHRCKSCRARAPAATAHQTRGDE